MATNKTRISYYDITSSNPYDTSLVLEFDIYQEAIDYVETFAKALALDSTGPAWVFSIYSYDNPSYRYYESGDEVLKIAITFPDNI